MMFKIIAPFNRLASASMRVLSLLFLLTTAPAFLFAQAPGTPYVTVGDLAAYNFSQTAAWNGSVVPGDSMNITISNNTITMDVDRVIATITLAPGGYLLLSDASVTITDQILCNQLNGIYDDGGTSTVILKSTVADGGSGTVTIGGGNDVTLYNVEVFDGSVVDFDSGGEGNTEVTITNQLKMGGGSVVVNPPIYGGSSTLLYDATYATVGAEWTAGASSGKGVPHDVTVGGSGSLSFGTTSSNYTCTGDFAIDDASGSLDLSGMLGDLTIDGNFTSGTNSAVTVTMPSVEGKGTITVGGNMTLNANTTWTGDESNVVIRGNLANNIVTPSTAFGLLKFAGNADQDITGNKITVDSLVVANTQNAVTDDTDVDFQADVDITPGGVFNPVDGTTRIAPGVTFTMNSDATGTARIATLADDGATSDVDGDITFERYVPAASGPTWLAAGNYVVGATRSEWTTSFGSDFHLVFDWDETASAPDEAGDLASSPNPWTIVSTGTDSLHNDGLGYALFTVDGSAPTLSATGTHNTAQQDLALSFSNGASQGGGWHIISNPFASPIDGSEFLSDNSGLISRYYMYDNANDIFKTDLTGAPATIDIGQAFWVQVSGAETLSFELDQVTHGVNSFLREVDPLDHGMFGLRIAQADGLYGHAFVRLHESATMDWEWDLDATRRPTGNVNAPEVYTELDNGHELLINAINFDGLEELTIPFVVETGAEGTVEIHAEPEFPVPSGLCAYIEDSETGERVAYSDELAMTVELDPQTTYQDRFVLVLMSAPEFEASSSHCEGGVVHFIGEDTGLWTIEWSNSTGDVDGTGCVTGLDAGDYIFEATNALNECRTASNITIDEVCMGDFNVNGERDITDLLILLVGIQPVENFEGTFPSTDCDCDGAMTTLDLLMFLPQFGNNCD
jgi:hypothetical protein